jgi:predicted methyltransferase
MKSITKNDLIAGILKMVAMHEMSIKMAVTQIQNFAESERIKWAKKDCGLCDGSGITEEGEFDNIIEKECLCAKEQIV